MDEVWSVAKQVIGTVAPTVATALGGPLAGTAVGAITSALGLDPETPPADVAKAVERASPDVLLKLRQAENDFQLAMRRIDIDVSKLALERDALSQKDRTDARGREAAVRDWVPQVLAITLSFGFLGLLFWLTNHEVPASSRDILNIALGSVGTGWVQMLSYYFGSSAPGAVPSFKLPAKA